MKRIAEDSYVMSDKRGVLFCKDKSLTQQHFAEEVDVNNIVDRALRTGVLGDPNVIASRVARFGDFSNIGSYQDAMNKVLAANAAFLELRADVRAKFNNDPAVLIDYLEKLDRTNFDAVKEAVDFGLVDKKLLDEVAASMAAKAAALPAAPKPA